MERYSAFLSYSHKDQREARWLHRAIETHRLPRPLIGADSPFGPVPRKLLPVFRDRDELPASGDLGSELRMALASSRFQIVLCSPAAARSHWVNEEIKHFKQLNGEGRTLALIVAGEPYSGGEDECFPPALRFRVDEQGEVTTTPAEPIAADLRPGMDGRKLALQKLVAGLTGVRLDDLVRRDNARRQKRLTIMAAVSSTIAVVTISLAIYAEFQRREAVAQRQLADRSLEFLIGTFEIANPATENPRTITALTVLDRASRRAADEFERDPAVSSRLLRTTGSIYRNLGLPEESERDLRAALARTSPQGEARAAVLLQLAMLATDRGDPEAVRDLVDQAASAYEADASYAPPLNAHAALQRANAFYLDARYEDAASAYAAAAQLYRRVEGDQRSDIAGALMNEAYARLQLRQYPQANALYKEALRLTVIKFGHDHLKTAVALHNQALSYLDAGRPASAAHVLPQAIAIYERVLERGHPTMGRAYLLLGRVHTARGDGESAVAALARARAVYVALYGIDNAMVGDVDFFTAEAELARGRFGAALSRAADAKALYDLNYGPDDPDQGEVLLLTSRIHAAAGSASLASKTCAEAMQFQRRISADRATLKLVRDECRRLSSQIATKS